MAGLDLTGRVALVTGAARGLGAGMAQALAAAGARVMIADVAQGRRRADRGRASTAAAFVELDVTNDAQWEGAVAHTVVRARRAGHRGEQRRHRGDLADRRRRPGRAPRDVRRQPARHAARAASTASARCARAVPRATAATVINIASVAATIAFPAIAGYSATKSGCGPADPRGGDGVRQARLRRARQLRLPRPGAHRHGREARRRDVRRSGLFESPDAAVGAVVELTPSGRLGEVSDMADAVVFLASDRPGSSTASACRSTAAWACDQGRAMSLTSYLDKGASLGPRTPRA